MSTSLTVSIACGALTGVRLPSGTCRFAGIPYAKAPMGDLRWRAPEAVSWSGELDARTLGPVAPQLPSRLAAAMGDFEAEQSEDCLHLTVWTPEPDNIRRPVVVWLHGGAWQSGAGALPWYDGAALSALGDVVVVAVNYRLAALGWLHLAGETSNVGLLDQEAAVAWVYQHIEDFGGDPERVTLMGQSAGGSNIVALLGRKPVFQRAIVQSGALGRGPRRADVAQRLGQALLSALGVDNLDLARALPVARLLAVQNDPQLLKILQEEGEGRALFGLVADGEVIASDWVAVIAQAANRADFLVGYTAHEMRAFGAAPDEVAQAKAGERVFGAPARELARVAVQGGRQAWLYQFALAPTQRWGACHCIELPFVFGSLDAFASAPMLKDLDGATGKRVTQEVQSAWLDFIRGTGPQTWAPDATEYVIQ